MKSVPEPNDKFKEVRNQTLEVYWRNSGFSPDENHPNVWAVVMEIGYAELAVSLICLMDGRADLYFGSGGGVLGGGEYPTVREKLKTFFQQAEGAIKRLNPTKIFPLPEIDRVRFYVRTFGETYTTQVNQANINNEDHELFPFFRAGHEVIAALREVDDTVKLKRFE